MPTLALCVPIIAVTREEVLEASLKRGYVWAGLKGAVLDARTHAPLPFEMEITGADPKLARAFRVAGGPRIPEAIYEEISRHAQVLYVTTDAAPSLELAMNMMRFAGALLEGGGLAVKVETAGVAHAPPRWRELLAFENTHLAVFHALTVRIAAEREDVVYSCGMQQFGLPDAEAGQISADHVELVGIFNGYVLSQRPRLRDGETFSVAANAPRYRMRHGPCTRFSPGDAFYNPAGVWRLEPVTGPALVSAQQRN